MSGPSDWLVMELVAERCRQGLSQREVARRAGISTGGMCEMERGDHSPTLRHLHAWAAALGLTITIRGPKALAENERRIAAAAWDEAIASAHLQETEHWAGIKHDPNPYREDVQ